MTDKRIRDLVIYCDRASNAVSELARRLNCRRVVANPNRKLRSMDGCLCINYGTSHSPGWRLGEKSILVNDFEAVSGSISKVESYERFKEAGIPTVQATTDRALASEWLRGGQRVLGRRDGLSSGAGINIYEASSEASGDTFDTRDQFFVAYFKKTHEYRVHVFLPRSRPTGGDGVQEAPERVQVPDAGSDFYKGAVIDITQKKRSTSGLDNQGPDSDNRTLHQRVVRSLENGWVHAHEDLHLPDTFRDEISKSAIKAVAALGLDFGAVDIIAQWGTKQTDKLYGYAVLEVNTAPGLGNEVTIEAYTRAIKELYTSTRDSRYIPSRPRRRKVRKLVKVWIVTKKGNRVQRERMRLVYE